MVIEISKSFLLLLLKQWNAWAKPGDLCSFFLVYEQLSFIPVSEIEKWLWTIVILPDIVEHNAYSIMASICHHVSSLCPNSAIPLM